MRITLESHTMVAGNPAQAGSTINVDEHVARALISMGKACVAVDKTPTARTAIDRPQRTRKKV